MMAQKSDEVRIRDRGGGRKETEGGSESGNAREKPGARGQGDGKREKRKKGEKRGTGEKRKGKDKGRWEVEGGRWGQSADDVCKD